MNSSTRHDRETASETIDLTPQQLANLLDAGLSPKDIDRLCFTRWRLRDTLAERGASLYRPTSSIAQFNPARQRINRKLTDDARSRLA
ncbi:MAG TPA: hypothetical protein VF201_01295 [Nitrolancea sp.]